MGSYGNTSFCIFSILDPSRSVGVKGKRKLMQAFCQIAQFDTGQNATLCQLKKIRIQVIGHIFSYIISSRTIVVFLFILLLMS